MPSSKDEKILCLKKCGSFNHGTSRSSEAKYIYEHRCRKYFPGPRLQRPMEDLSDHFAATFTPLPPRIIIFIHSVARISHEKTANTPGIQ
jgi:hypothetical protein